MATDDKTGRTDVSAVPLYQQVMDDLKGEITRGVYAAGSRIPSEMELAKSYGVGRITVRRAIEELSRAGYLNRQQGRGTFVCAPKLKRKIRQKGDVQSFTEGCAANDMVPGARLVSRTVVAATREDASFLAWSRLRAHRGRARAHGRWRARHAREQRLCACRPSVSANDARRGPHR